MFVHEDAVQHREFLLQIQSSVISTGMFTKNGSLAANSKACILCTSGAKNEQRKLTFMTKASLCFKLCCVERLVFLHVLLLYDQYNKSLVDKLESFILL